MCDMTDLIENVNGNVLGGYILSNFSAEKNTLSLKINKSKMKSKLHGNGNKLTICRNFKNKINCKIILL